MSTTKKNIYQKINEVMKKVDYVKKDLKVQGYSAISHDSVTATVRKYMVDEGIVLTVNQTYSQLDDREQGSKMRMYHGTYLVRFTNIDDKDDCIEISVNAESLDNGDKAPGKCMSYATKYALLKTFMIETGENEESRTHDPGNELISGVELDELNTLLKKADRTPESVLEYLGKNGVELDSLGQMNVALFQRTKNILVNAIEKQNAA